MTLTLLENLPDIAMWRDRDPLDLRDEIKAIIADTIKNQPRSLQKALGPSELGSSCARRLGYKMLDVTPVNTGRVGWKPAVGSAVHLLLEQTMMMANDPKQPTRWLCELTVEVGNIGGIPITGHLDLYDRKTATIVDYKVVGATRLKEYRAKAHPGAAYRTQQHLYGKGVIARGLPVDRVAVFFFPQNGELDDSYFWSEPYDEQVALDALERANGIHDLTAALGTAALPLLPTADAFCSHCPYLKVNSDDVTTACPGDPSRKVYDSLAGITPVNQGATTP